MVNAGHLLKPLGFADGPEVGLWEREGSRIGLRPQGLGPGQF